jgi:uncharacterized protein (TIGR00297 family)
MVNIILYIVVILATVFSGYYLRYLTFSGSVTAAAVGISVALGFGWKGLVLLGLFFSTSSLWSKFKDDFKSQIEQKNAKGSRRDWQQVLANGGIAVVSSLLFYYYEHPIWILAFSVSIASANSDTWASEIGTLSKHPPLFIRTFKRSEKGTSGAVSLLGSFAALLGSLLIAVFATFLFKLDLYYLSYIFLFGFLGNVFDTIMGAFLQASYLCPICQTEMEKTIHCNKRTKLKRGIPCMNNEVVNFLSGLLATIVGSLCFLK